MPIQGCRTELVPGAPLAYKHPMQASLCVRLRVLMAGLSFLILGALAPPVRGAADLDGTQALFLKGGYAECIKACEQAIADDESSDETTTF